MVTLKLYANHWTMLLDHHNTTSETNHVHYVFMHPFICTRTENTRTIFGLASRTHTSKQTNAHTHTHLLFARMNDSWMPRHFDITHICFRHVVRFLFIVRLSRTFYVFTAFIWLWLISLHGRTRIIIFDGVFGGCCCSTFTDIVIDTFHLGSWVSCELWLLLLNVIIINDICLDVTHDWSTNIWKHWL